MSIDFSKGFDSVHHNYFKAFFLYIGLPVPLIALILSMLTSPFIFRVGKGVVPVVQLHPKSGVPQGDQLSPALFAMVCSVLIPMLQHLSPHIHALFYADHLVLYIPLPPGADQPHRHTNIRNLTHLRRLRGALPEPQKIGHPFERLLVRQTHATTEAHWGGR